MSKPLKIKTLGSSDVENILAAITEGGIEAQESAGQQAMVNDEVIPKDCPRKDLEALGFIFCDDLEDDLFIRVQMPEGWSKRATDHSMHSDLIDGKGRVRGNIFYKAAFYDRKADMTLRCRFYSARDYESESQVVVAEVTDSDKRIFATEPVIIVDDLWSEEGRRVRDVAEADAAAAWLKERYPDHANVNAYWD